MDWHALAPEVVLRRLKSSEKGLAEGEVQKKFAEHGKNVIRKFKRKSKLVVFLVDGS